MTVVVVVAVIVVYCREYIILSCSGSGRVGDGGRVSGGNGGSDSGSRSDCGSGGTVSGGNGSGCGWL